MHWMTLPALTSQVVRYCVLGVVLAVWVIWAASAVVRQGTWLDEVNYVIKAWWYVNGVVEPYSSVDSTGYLPLHLFALGLWQKIFGFGLFVSRSLSALLTAVDILLIAMLLRRLGVGIYGIAFTIVVFALNEESTFYFSSATPYALAVTLQLAALHVLIGFDARSGLSKDLALAAFLTLAYLLRPDLAFFIALALGTAVARGGKAGLRAVAVCGGVFVAAMSVLTWLWGREFAYVGLNLPGLSDVLRETGLMPDLYPYARRFSDALFYQRPESLWELFRRAFRREVVFSWHVMFHVVPVGGALFATIVAIVSRPRLRGWIIYFSAAYWASFLYYLVAGTLQCGICGQAYLNYADYLAAIAAGLALHSVLSAWPARASTIGVSAFAALVVLIVAQSRHLEGGFALPTGLRDATPLTSQVNRIATALRGIVSPNEEMAVLASDRRLLLALVQAEVKIPAWTLIAPFNYRRIREGLDEQIVARTAKEIEELSDWTDITVRRWLSETYGWLLVQERPAIVMPDWSIWHPRTSLVATALTLCFTRDRVLTVTDVTPPIEISLYRRVESGSRCLGEG